MSDSVILAVIAAVATYFGHEYLHSGLWESVPLATTETAAVGLGLAVVAAAGTYLAVEAGGSN